MFLNIRRETPVPECPFCKYKCSLELKPIFIQKEAPVQVFSWQLSKIFNNNFFSSLIDLIMKLFALNFAKISEFQEVKTGYVKKSCLSKRINKSSK